MNDQQSATDARASRSPYFPEDFDGINVTLCKGKPCLKKLASEIPLTQLRNILGNVFFNGPQAREDLKVWCQKQTGTKKQTHFEFYAVIPGDKENIVRIRIDFDQVKFTAERIPMPGELGYVIRASKVTGH